jgi:hypothetical protein
MRRSLSYFQSCYVRYNGGMPQFLDMRGKRNLDILKMLKAAFSPRFDKFMTDELELWKPDGQKVTKISDLILSDHETEENALILRLKPKKIKIKDELGFITEHEVTSQNHLETFLINQGSKGLMSSLNIKILNFEDLSDGKIYRSLIPKTISVISDGSDSEVEDTVPLYSDKDLQGYLYTRDLYYLAEMQDITKIVSFDTIRPEKTYIGRPRDPAFKRWYAIDRKTIEEEACAAAKAEIARLLRDQNIDDTLIDKSDEFKKDGQRFFECDGIFYAPGNDCLYLVECKHSMRQNLLKQIVNMRDDFMAKLQESGLADGKRFKTSYTNIIGIACARNFPNELRLKAESDGLLTLAAFEATEGASWR